MSSYNIAFFRGVFSLITITPFIFFTKYNIFSGFRNFIHGNIARVILAFSGTYCFAEGLKHTPLNEAVAITFSTPILTSIMSVLWLKDKFNVEKCIAIFIGISGVAIILKPDITALNYSSLHVLAASFIWSLSSIIIKILSKDLPPVLMIFYVSLLTIIFSLPYFLYNPYIPTQNELILLFSTGALQNIAQILMIHAYRNAHLSVVTPFDFMRLILAAFLGIMFFDEKIESHTLFGAVMIISGCSLIAVKEKKLKSKI